MKTSGGPNLSAAVLRHAQVYPTHRTAQIDWINYGSIYPNYCLDMFTILKRQMTNSPKPTNLKIPPLTHHHSWKKCKKTIEKWTCMMNTFIQKNTVYTRWRMRLLDIFHHQHQGLVPVGAQCGDLHRWLLEENGGISDLYNGGISWCFPITTHVLILKVLVSEEWVEVRVKEINMIFWGPNCLIRLKSHFHSSLPGRPAAQATSLRWPTLQHIFHRGPWAVITSATARPLSFNSESMANFKNVT